MKRGWRLALRGFALVVMLLLAVPGYFVLRYGVFGPRWEVESIAAAPQYQDPALLDRAWQLPTAQTFPRELNWQHNGSTCGASSLANILQSLGESKTEEDLLSGTGKCWTGICFGGLTLDELAEIARDKTGRDVEILRGLEPGEFRRHLRQSNDPSLRYVVNFHRGPLFGKGGGHHSPIGGYFETEDLVFVLDVNENFQPWLVPAERLYEAIRAEDELSGKERGLLLLK